MFELTATVLKSETLYNDQLHAKHPNLSLSQLQAFSERT